MAVTASIFLSPIFKCVIKVFSLAKQKLKLNITLEYTGLYIGHMIHV